MVTTETKQRFHTVLKEECGFVGDHKESEEILMTLVKYYRHLDILNRKIESPQKSQN